MAGKATPTKIQDEEHVLGEMSYEEAAAAFDEELSKLRKGIG